MSLSYEFMLKIQVFHNQTDKLARGVGDTMTAWNQIAMQSRKCRSCELWYKETERKTRNSNKLMELKVL